MRIIFPGIVIARLGACFLGHYKKTTAILLNLEHKIPFATGESSELCTLVKYLMNKSGCSKNLVLHSLCTFNDKRIFLLSSIFQFDRLISLSPIFGKMLPSQLGCEIPEGRIVKGLRAVWTNASCARSF